MKKIRKVIALVLVATILACCAGLTMNASAITFFGIEIGEKDKKDVLKWLVYTSDTPGVTVVYLPGGSLKTDNGYAVVTDDTPLAIDHVFVRWEDENGNEYKPGESYYVTKLDNLYAVWADKEDNDGHLLRVIKTCMEALSRVLRFVFSIYEVEQDFSQSYFDAKNAEALSA